jgi:hypothetical protein
MLSAISHPVSLSLSWNKESNQRKFKAAEKWLKFDSLRYNESANVQHLFSIQPLQVPAFVHISTLSLLNAALLKFLNAIFLRPALKQYKLGEWKIGVQKLWNAGKKGELKHRRRRPQSEASFHLGWRLRWKVVLFYSISCFSTSNIFFKLRSYKMNGAQHPCLCNTGGRT